jgi:hypothetical protein
MADQKKRTLASFLDEALKQHPWPNQEHELDRQNNFYEILVNQYNFYLSDPESFLINQREKALFRICEGYTSQTGDFVATNPEVAVAIDTLHTLVLGRKKTINDKLAKQARQREIEAERARAEKESVENNAE